MKRFEVVRGCVKMKIRECSWELVSADIADTGQSVKEKGDFRKGSSPSEPFLTQRNSTYLKALKDQ
jgi:hypothetical protein